MISDKTRKILWVKTGNRCAICKQKLVIDETEMDEKSVVGDECHIVSEKSDGPRFSATFPKDKVDDVSNLIILCKTHHKMVDDQTDTYTTEKLNNIKRDHENWVEAVLSHEEVIKPIKLKRYKANQPKKLAKMLSGKSLLNLASRCSLIYSNFPDDLSDEETELVGGFIQTIMDWSDMSGELEPIEFVRAAKNITEEMIELGQNDFKVFAGIEKQTLEGGIGESSDWNALHLSVLRKTDPSII